MKEKEEGKGGTAHFYLEMRDAGNAEKTKENEVKIYEIEEPSYWLAGPPYVRKYWVACVARNAR